MKHLLRNALALALALSVTVPVAAAASSRPGDTERIATVTMPGDQAACAAAVAQHPELAGQPCVLTLTYPVNDVGFGLVETARAASGSECTWIKASSLAWWVQEDFCWQWNGATSLVNWATCSQWNFGVGIDVTWCGWYNGWAYGYQFADAGANWIKSAFLNGFPLQTSCWMRVYLYKDGTKGVPRGAC